MAEITAAMVKELREKTGAGMMDCKKALTETGGDMEKATDALRKKGLMDAGKKASRVASEGLVSSYIHGAGKIGVLLEVNCETDFVARNPDFIQFNRDIAMHIAASNPICVRREEVPADIVARERAIFEEQAKATGKPAPVIQKIVDGRVDKFFAENCLMEQKFIKDQDKSISDVLTALIAKIGENISVRRFTRYVLGEGLQKKEENFADEVARTAGLK
ncbi:MAG: translation elongation factor Ts [Myxococcota bacterium]